MQVPGFLALLVLSLFPRVLHAQCTNGSITGRVTDPWKATIAEAKVAGVNLGTNFSYETAINSSSECFLTNLPPGACRLKAEMPGFKRLIRPDVTLRVQDALEINLEMSLGSAADSVAAGSNMLLIETESATVSKRSERDFR